MLAFDGYNQLFPNQPCSECSILLLQRHIKRAFRNNDPLYQYGITRVFGIPVDGPRVVLCLACVKKPTLPADCGQIPDCILTLLKPYRRCLSPFRLHTNLGRTQGWSQNRAMTYYTLTGQIMYRAINPRAIALFSGALGAYLESDASDAIDWGTNQAGLRRCRDWLLVFNPAFNKNYIRRNLQVPNPLP
jgi:hypothetical protein